MPRASVFLRCACMGAFLSIGVSGVSSAVSFASATTDDGGAVVAAEQAIRLAAEEAAARIQRSVSANVNTIMARRPATSFNLRNAVRAGQNSVNAASVAARARFAEIVTDILDELQGQEVPLIDVVRLSAQYDVEIDDNLRELTEEGIRDLASLVRSGRRTNSVRGTLVGRYELFISQPENRRDPVKLGEVVLGESQMIRGLISTAAAAEFFLYGMDVATPRVVDLPEATAIKAVRWLYRAGPLVISSDNDRATTTVPLNADTFLITGIDMLPERLRFELELLLEDTPDITINIDGADGFFRSVTYTFRRVADEP